MVNSEKRLAPSEIINKANRLVNIWSERKLFSTDAIAAFKSKLRMMLSYFPLDAMDLTLCYDVAAPGSTPSKSASSTATPSSSKKSVSFAPVPTGTQEYEAPHPISKAIQKITSIEKKRLAQGGQMAAGINANLTDAGFVSHGKGARFS
jgi:hypothetical protein